MAKAKILKKKEEPRYRVQKQYERDTKKNYYTMLVNMGKSLLAITTKQLTNDFNPPAGTGFDGGD